jgi:flagellar hook-basal body complex protein FliE
MHISGLTSSIPLPTEISAPELAGPSITASSPASSLATGGDGSSFTNVLNSAINEVESSRTSAAASVDQFLSGEGGDLHSTILASQRADLEFQMFMQVRNKIVSAYQEVMKMQL